MFVVVVEPPPVEVAVVVLAAVPVAVVVEVAVPGAGLPGHLLGDRGRELVQERPGAASSPSMWP